MKRRRERHVVQAVRPVLLGDVEEESGGAEEERGEEPSEVEVRDEQVRGGERREKEREEDPRRMVPEEGAVRRMRNIGDPRLPTRAEVDNHNITHVPYRNWCPHCVRGRGKDLDHRRSVEDERRVQEFAFDYCFMGDDGGAKVTILAGRERTTGMTMATVVPAKGSSGQFAVLKVLEFIRLCGAEETDIVIKSDQEPAIAVLVRDVVQARRGAATVVEKSPVASSGSNGVVERAIQSVEGLIRTLKCACEARWGIQLRPDEKTVIFIAEYAAYLLNKLEIGKDGKTAWERSRGKKGAVMAVEFGEKVLWKVRPSGRLAKMSPKWEEGVFVGVKADSGEVWVAARDGLQTVRAIRRLPQEQRWAAGNRDLVRHVPWNRAGEDPDADGDMPEDAAPVGEQQGGGGGGGQEPRVVVVNVREPAPKEFYIKKRDVEAHGVTPGCAGCRTMFLGGTRQNHSAECRERFRALLQGEERVQRMEAKKRDYAEKAAEAEEKKKDKKRRKEEQRAGRKRAAEDDDLDVDERLARAAQAEGEQDGSRPARPDSGDALPGSSGDGGRGTSGDGGGGSSGDGGGGSSGDGGGGGSRGVDGGGPSGDGGGRGSSGNDGGGLSSDGGMDVDAILQENVYWDDVRGGWLDRRKVHEARMEEVTFMRKENLWDAVPRSQAAGHRVVSVRWVDTNKGTEDKPEIRSRLVARDFNGGWDKDREDLFAATPPWELKRLLLSLATVTRAGKCKKVLLIDVKKAHLYPPCAEDVFVELPEEAGEGPDRVGRLRRMLYGLRSAAATWENHYAGKLVSVGFERGMSSPVSFYHPGRQISLVVHGDDFTFVGAPPDLDWIQGHTSRW